VTQILPPRFTLADAERAHAEWGCNCGPSAIAAMAQLTLDEVRPFVGDFERKRYTNPTLMLDTLSRLHRDGLIAGWRKDTMHQRDLTWPNYGVVRIQWEGPWTKLGVPMRARYRHTHWVGAARLNDDTGIFDINCINNGCGWVSLKNWREITVPWILQECVPRATGGWHITHVIEVDLAAAELAA
jgi:hypothetical protein